MRDEPVLERLFPTDPISRQAFLRRTALGGLSISGASVLLSACGGDDDEAAGTAPTVTEGEAVSGTVTILRGPFGPNDASWEEPLHAAFNERFSDANVNTTLFDWEAADAQIAAAFASGDPPDVIYLPDQWYGQYAEAGQLEDLTPFVSDPSYADESNKFIPRVWDVAKLDEKIYGIPVLSVIYPVFVNLDLLDAAGVTDTWNTSYDAAAEAARKLTTDEVWGFSVRSSFVDSAFWDWFPYVHNAGGDILNEDWTACGFDTPDAIAGIQFILDRFSEGSAVPAAQYDTEGLKALFQAGRIALHHHAAGFAVDLETNPPDFRWDIALGPSGPVDQTVMGNFGFLFMSSASENKEAAWEYIKHFTSAEGIRLLLKDRVAAFPARTDLDAADQLDPADPNFEIQQKAVTELLPTVRGIQPHPQMREILNAMWPSFEAAYRGPEFDAQEAVAKACAEIGAVLPS